jgi:hypothetical protein
MLQKLCYLNIYDGQKSVLDSKKMFSITTSGNEEHEPSNKNLFRRKHFSFDRKLKHILKCD